MMNNDASRRVLVQVISAHPTVSTPPFYAFEIELLRFCQASNWQHAAMVVQTLLQRFTSFVDRNADDGESKSTEIRGMDSMGNAVDTEWEHIIDPGASARTRNGANEGAHEGAQEGNHRAAISTGVVASESSQSNSHADSTTGDSQCTLSTLW